MSMIYTKNTPRLQETAMRAAKGSHPLDAIVSLVFAAMSVESFVNDLIGDVSLDPRELAPPLAHLRELAAAADLEERNVPLFRKIQVTHVALTGKRGDMGQQPFQDLGLLLRIRNELVHSHPEVFKTVGATTPEGVPTEHQTEPHSLVVELVQRGIVNLPPKEVLTGLLAVLLQFHRRVGVWAYNSAIATINHLIGLLPDPGWKVALSAFIYKDKLEIPPTDQTPG